MGNLARLLVVCSLFGAACQSTRSGGTGNPQAQDGAMDVDGGPAEAGDGAGWDAEWPPGFDVLQPPEPCNGTAALCQRTYDAVSYPTTHGAIAYSLPPFACPAQTLSIRVQLEHGIRAFDLEAYPSSSPTDGGPSALDVCLNSCPLGALPASVALQDVSSFLAANPREVVTLLVEGGVQAPLLQSALAAEGLDQMAFSKATSDPWPTLDAMIATGKRVVVLADVTGTAPPWMLPLWTYVSETGRTFTTVSSMTCDITRGPPNAPLFLLNQFLVDGEAGAPSSDGGQPLSAGCDDPSLAHVVNADPFFTNRVTVCTQVHGKEPTFVSVDDFQDGVLLNLVPTLNR
jgi:hypothetical protein